MHMHARSHAYDSTCAHLLAQRPQLSPTPAPLIGSRKCRQLLSLPGTPFEGPPEHNRQQHAKQWADVATGDGNLLGLPGSS